MEYTAHTKRAPCFMRPYEEGESLQGVAMGQHVGNPIEPKLGDWIAIDPGNTEDKWLITAEFYRQHYAPVEHPLRRQELLCTNELDANGNPAGGTVDSTGMAIEWQNGVVQPEGPNGAFVTSVLLAARQKLEHYQDSKFRCRENACAITHIDEAVHWLDARTIDRMSRGVENTHKE